MERFACNPKHQARVNLFSNRSRMLETTSEVLMVEKTKNAFERRRKDMRVLLLHLLMEEKKMKRMKRIKKK